ncbi:MAG: SGNH/GDSL hydrolase family protein [Thermodesulfobacteriota bacterium]
MIYKQVKLHNIEDLVAVIGFPGLRMQRVPEALRLRLNPNAQFQMCRPSCAEIRFVSERPVDISLSCPDGRGMVEVFYGPFQDPECHEIRDEITVIHVEMPNRMTLYDQSKLSNLAFSPKVCRLLMAGDAMFLHDMEGDGCRPPNPDELPRLRYLAYGTSITEHGRCTAPHLTYVEQAGIRLGADVINLGCGGSAYCEPELAEYIAERTDWDFATLSISVNMLKFTPAFFYERAANMIHTICRANPRRPVICITLFPYAREFGDTFMGSEDQGAPDEYREALHKAVRNCDCDNVYIMEGSEVLDDVGGLSTDMLHPGDQGMIFMGENLARQIKHLIDNLRH